MDKLQITGGQRLVGEISISGAKNAALPLMIASLLTDQTLTLRHVPHLADIKTLTELLMSFGTEIIRDGDEIRLTTKTLTSAHADYELVRKMRASIFVLGPLLARNGSADVSLPGGCAIGTRPVDLHLSALEALGAEIVIEQGYIKAKAPHGLKAAEYIFPKVSVGATENMLMAACLADGISHIKNAAKEPEVTDLAKCLVAMGVEIEGIGTDHLIVHGKNGLLGAATHDVLPDRIETGSYAIAACMTQGEITLTNTDYSLLSSFWSKLKQSGAHIEKRDEGKTVKVSMTGRPKGVDVMTEPHPGFPTDLQAQMMALNTIAEGAGMVTETIFENRFMHVPELCRLGANITVHGGSALIRGVDQLKGAQVMATDLRASMALVLAGLAADGDTVINRIYHLDRGYDALEEKLSRCGAQIKRIK